MEEDLAAQRIRTSIQSFTRKDHYFCKKNYDIIFRDVLPFQVHVELNDAEPITQPAANNKNRGFSIDYRQLLC